MVMAPGSLRGVRALLGRESQLAVATARLADLDASRGATLLLTGEPGIGKTRLAEEVAALARERGYRSVWSTAWQGEGAPPLWPWVQILRQLALTEEILSQFEADSPAASPAACFAQSEAICAVVRSVSSDGPLVVVLDDLQWADAASIRVLCAVASAVRDAGCLLIGTYRPEELAREHAAELARVGVTLAVPKLSDEAAAALLRSSVGDNVSAVASGTVIERSAGNPLFVWEFGQLMAQSGRVDIAPAAVPDAVAAVIERRLARLSEPAVETLRAGAIAGNPFSVETVARIGGTTFAEATDGLEAAVTMSFVARIDHGADLRFSHDVVRDVILSGIDSARRAELHLRAAAVFEERLAVDPSLHAVVANHLELVGVGHAEAAAAHWEQAAHRARRVLAFDEAARCLAHAGRGRASDPMQRAALLVDEGECLLLAGDLEAARARFLEAAEVARRSHAPETMARAVLGIGAGPVAWEVPIASTEHAVLVADALELLPDGATELRSMLLARLSVTAATPETMATARQRATDALDLAQQVADPALIAHALAAMNDAFGGPAHTMTRRDNADTIVELAVECGDRVLELVGYRFRIVADLEVGDVAAVDRSITAFTRLAEQLRQPLVSWYVPLFQGMRSLLAGELDTADRHERAVAAASETTGSHNAQMLAATLRLGIDLARGRPTDPGAFDQLFDIDPAEWASFAAGLAMMKLHGGEPDRARELLKLHADNDFVHLGEDGEQLTTLIMFGRVAVALEELAAADRVYDLLSPHAGLWAVDGIAACTWGPVDLELGRIALALGQPREARAHLEQARDSAERVGARLFAHEATTLVRQCGRAPEPTTSAAPREAATVFRRDGQFWTLSFRGRTVRMKDAKGLHDLAWLISEPTREVHVLDLAGARSDPTGPTVTGVGDLGELLDTRARAEYRRRLAELEDEVADAARCNDLARAERAGAERDFIAAELAAALGLDGRPRRAGDPAERARKAVTARIRLTIGRIDREHSDLGRHLANSVRTGTNCSYRPETPVLWTV
jgi:predicted ATPase